MTRTDYKEPEFKIVVTSSEDILTSSYTPTEDFETAGTPFVGL